MKAIDSVKIICDFHIRLRVLLFGIEKEVQDVIKFSFHHVEIFPNVRTHRPYFRQIKRNSIAGIKKALAHSSALHSLYVQCLLPLHKHATHRIFSDELRIALVFLTRLQNQGRLIGNHNFSVLLTRSEKRIFNARVKATLAASHKRRGRCVDKRFIKNEFRSVLRRGDAEFNVVENHISLARNTQNFVSRFLGFALDFNRKFCKIIFKLRF